MSCFLMDGLLSQPSKYEGRIIEKIDFIGLKNVDREDLYEVMKATTGYPLKSSEVQQDIKNIFDKGMFESIVVEIEEHEKGVKLRFICRERPMIKSIEFRGLDELAESELTTIILAKEGEVLRKDILEKSVKQLKMKYEEEGLFNAVIKYSTEQVDDNENLVNVFFTIDEGEEIKVNHISLLGAKKIYPGKLKGLMETKEDSFFRDGSFREETYEQDKVKIIAYYKENGYLDAQIIEDTIQYEWVDPIEKDERGIFITIKLSEGEKYYFNGYSVQVRGDKDRTVFKPDDFMKFFEQQEKDMGDVFDNTKFEKDKQMISFRYASKGYIFARVRPVRTVTEKEVTVKGKKEKRKFIKVDFQIFEGSQAHVETIMIKGNKKTKDRVIRREIIVKEGELFDSRKMQISRERVFNLGFFKQVNIDVRPGSREGYMNLIVDVEEQPTGTISLGGGYGTTSGFSIFADVGENNLLGNGQRVGVRLEYGPLRSSVTISFNERWLFGYPVGFSSSIFYNLYTIETGSLFPNSSEVAEYKKQSFGYSMGLSYRFWYYYNVGGIWSHAFKSIVDPSGNCGDSVFITEALGIQEKRTVTLYTYRDSKDNYMNPTAGSKIGMKVAITGGSVLGGGDHFIKYYPEMNFYYSPFHLPFLKTHPCVFELRANATLTGRPLGSVSQNYEKNEWLESEDRLYMGGPETIRGWDYFDLEFPSSWRSIGLPHRILYGLEFRVPVHPQMLWFAFFFDAGSLWSDTFWEKQLGESSRETVLEDYESGEVYRLDEIMDVDLMSYFRYSYGFGFRIQIPMMPLRFWFGRKMIYDGSFRTISGYNFQFGIGDMRF